MAAIDKIYVDSYNKYLEFKDWCSKQPKLTDKYGKQVSISAFLYGYPEPFEGEHPIFKAPCYVDAYVIRNCPFEYIQKELMLRYGEESQDFIDEAYETVMARGGGRAEPGQYFSWLCKDDFAIKDGVITLLNTEESSYQKIKKGLIYTSPRYVEPYTAGKHFRCIKHPLWQYNKPYGIKRWWVQVTLPDGMGFMWYNKKHNQWDFADEFVYNNDYSLGNTAYIKTIKAIKHNILRWHLPIDTIICVTGRYLNDDYKFIVTK